MAATGYSGTPLAKKLGIMEGSVLAVYGAPVAYRQLFSDWPEGVDIVPDKSVPKDKIIERSSFILIVFGPVFPGI